MTIADFVSQLHSLDVRLSAEGERLRLNAPQGVLTDSLRLQIAERKQELIVFLRDTRASATSTPPPIVRRATGKPAPLSFAQERLWFLEQLEPGSPVYNLCRAYRLMGKLNLFALEASLNEIVRRHEILRSAICIADGQPLQVTKPLHELKLSVVDIKAMSEAEHETEMRQRIQQAADTPFDLSAGKFLRVELLRIRDDEHVLILTTHHIVSDAWSMGILTRELWSLYKTYAAGKSSDLEKLPTQYADFAVWQREWLEERVLGSHVSYWKKQLKDLPILNLPTDRPRPLRQSFTGAKMSITFSESLTAAINNLSNERGVTPFMTLLVAFQLLLYRYSGQEDIVVGSPIANRFVTELEQLIGFFVNTVVLRVDLSGNPTFEELLFRVREVCLAGYEHKDLPFEKLVRELEPERDQSRNPLFQVMFALQNATQRFSPPAELTVEPIESETGRSLFDLSLFLKERDGRYIGYFEYSVDLFDAPTVERMAGHFQILLEAIVADPDQSIATLPILTAAERHQILVDWNDTAADYPKDKCIHQLFEDQVEKTPNAVAVLFERQQITYRELNTRANQLAQYLRSLGVGPEVLVGICVERSLEMVVGLLGILKAGGAYVPLDPAYPRERLAFILEDAQVSLLLTAQRIIEDGTWRIEDGTRSSILDPQTKVVCLDRDWPLISEHSEERPTSGVDSQNLVYVIYTSGSTGKPKGVAIEHRNTVNLLQWAKTIYGRTELAGVLASTSICFDLSVFELFVPMTCGGKVILAKNALCLHDLAAKQEITLINTVPSAVAQVLALSPLPESVRVVNLAGEPLKAELVEKLYQEPNVEKVYDLYGPSETTTYSTFTLRTREGPTTIGRPIANTCVFIFDSLLQPTPVGVEGELYIGGDGLARRYLNWPELTSKRFVPHPFSNDPDNRLYRTGDRARYRADGNIEFQGRTDNQVKIRGYRIELGEIEALLNQHPTIKESVVVVRDRDSSGENDLIAYFVPQELSPITISGLRNFLRDKLPDYMVPTRFVELEHMPLLPNGKIDRMALRLPDNTRPELKDTYIEPRTQVEELLIQIWGEVLNIDGVGIRENFFELGGHSLLAIQIISRVREVFDKDVPLSALFDTPTVAGLAATIEKTIRGRSSDLPPIVRRPLDGPVPLSRNQEHLWRLSQIMPGSIFFNIPYVYRLSGNLNVEALEQAVTEIVQRHETLRTVFEVVCGEPMQVIYEVTDIQLACHDLRSTEQDIVAGRAAAVMLEEREYPFRLATGPLFRVALVRLTETESLLLITMHHIVSDYWSMQIFSQELALIYNQIVCGEPLDFTKPALQFADYAYWERRMLATGAFDKNLDFWRRQLAPPLTIIGFRKRREASTGANFLTSRRSFEFDKHLVAAVKTFAKVEKCTTSMAFLAALNILLFGETGHTDMRVGLLMANRGNLHLAGTMGHFMNTVVIRTPLAPDMTCRQLLYRVRASVLAAHAHQQLPFEYLASVLEEKDRIDRASLFQVLVMYRYSTAQPYELAGLHFAPIVITQPDTDAEVMITTHDLVLDIRETSTKLTGSVNFSLTSCCEIIDSLAEQLAIILHRMTSGELDEAIGKVAVMQ